MLHEKINPLETKTLNFSSTSSCRKKMKSSRLKGDSFVFTRNTRFFLQEDKSQEDSSYGNAIFFFRNAEMPVTLFAAKNLCSYDKHMIQLRRVELFLPQETKFLRVAWKRSQLCQTSTRGFTFVFKPQIFLKNIYIIPGP